MALWMPSKCSASETSDGQIHLQGFCNRPTSLLGHGNVLFRVTRPAGWAASADLSQDPGPS